MFFLVYGVVCILYFLTPSFVSTLGDLVYLWELYDVPREVREELISDRAWSYLKKRTILYRPT